MNHKSRCNEKVTNGALARRIRQVMHGRQTRAECTRTIAGKGNAGLKPDVLVTAKGRSPVIIEAEYMPAPKAEEEARERLGRRIHQHRRIPLKRSSPCATPKNWPAPIWTPS